jgi:hypothetical protein
MLNLQGGDMHPWVGLLCCALLLGLLPLSSSPAATFDISDYRFWLLPAQKNREIHLNGRIEGGAPCKALHLEIKLLGEKGDKAMVRAIVREAGSFGSRLIEAKSKTKAPTQSWDIEDVKLRCKER